MGRLGRWGASLVLVIAVVLGAGGFVFLLAHWPFTSQAVAKTLGSLFKSTVRIEGFRRTYFPPGCVAEGISFADGRAQGGIQRLQVAARWGDLLAGRRRIQRIQADGLYIRVLRQNDARPAPTGPASSLNLEVGEIIAEGALLEVARSNPGSQPLIFDIHSLKLSNVARGRPMSFRTALRNPEPPGEIQAAGEIGPWRPGNPAATVVSGSFTFDRASLGVFHAIAGTLSSKGTFHGPLNHVDVNGLTQLPDFEVTHSGHMVRLNAQFQAVVNGTNGDTFLKPVQAQLERTAIVSDGSIAGRQGAKGKFWSLNLAVRRGHIQDLMRLLMRSSRPPMVGLISFTARAMVPPEQRRFLERLQLSGDFGVEDVKFTAPNTQHNVEVLSERARGDKQDDDDPENVISDLRGHVCVKDGVARFSNLSFGVPGARAQLAGTFNLLTEHIDLHGKLAMAAELSHATKGFKSFLLKALDPFFKKRNAGAVVNVRITGTYSHPSYGVALTKNHEVGTN